MSNSKAVELKVSKDNLAVTGVTLLDGIDDLHDKGKDVRVTFGEWPKGRSMQANSVQWVWYSQIGKFTSTDTKTVASECKIDFGLPILLADEEVGPILGHALRGFSRMTREQQIKFISVIQVTSIMSSKQHTQYRDAIVNYYNLHGLNINYR